MTVYESLVRWINEILTDPQNNFPPVRTVTDIEAMPNIPESQNAALYSSPNDTQTQLSGGQVKHTAYKTFYIRRDFKERASRLENEVFVENLKRCIYEKNLDGIMPDDGRGWESIECNAGIYPAQRHENDDYADYLVPLKLVYVE